ncbi:hypothetical protein C9374_012472 [Naegleria lovaniensis]|uniref:Uncharacterized protein n=1 Tax=Naegleria lovaniensis TaxID=51637 RepID=A0AA88GZT0_NAELO|nr:uncharacterized protein C9374_012472 [Naegleria lovaniensis]KAG2392220.1 hypothetical protein C9374_012472 [Naegleria lovaniensis]
MKTRVVKLECGDFHVVLLHEDGSVSVAGSNNFSQLTPKAKFSGDNVFCTLDLNYLSVQDIFSGSNSMIYVKDVYNTSKIIYYAGAAMPSEFVPSQNEPMEISEIRHEKENEISLISGSNRELFDVQYTKDFCLLRYWDRPHLLFLYGCRYYPYKKIEQTMVDLSKLFPYNQFTTSTNFYRDILQVRVQCLGFAIYCDFQKHSKSRMFQQLFKTLDSETPNHHLLYDISII